ncbi:MAG: beta strand repeat-containing protein [Roseibacillus sp.]
MKSSPLIRLFSCAVATAAVFAPSWSSLNAQISGTPGDIVVRSNFNAANLATNPGDEITVQFDFDDLGNVNLPAVSPDHLLSQGKYLVLYSTRFDHGGGDQRAEVNTHLSLEPAGGGAPVDLVYGTAQGFIRTSSGANEVVVSGGTIVEAAATGDILRLHAIRTDENGSSLKNLIGGATSIQFLKLEDTWDYLRLSNTLDQAAAGNATFLEVLYDQVEEASAGAMSFTANTGDITFNQDGRYLVMANTSLLSTNLGSTARTGYTQRLTLDGTPIQGSTTTTYVRGHPNADGCHNGVLAIGTIVQATAGQILRVETAKEQGINCTVTSAGTGLAIVQLPSFGQYISLSDNSGQDLNVANPGASHTFGNQNLPIGSDFTHSIGTSVVTVNSDGNYLFLSAWFCNDDTADRQIPWQRWKVDNINAFWGGATRYSRNNQIDQNGNWSGFLVPLLAGQTVEIGSQALGAGGIVPGDDLGLQGVRIGSLFLSNDPLLAVNNSLNLVQNTSGTITSALLQTVDADTPATGLTYTVDSLPGEGTLFLNAVALVVTDTFTQDDVDQGLLTFDAGTTPQTNLIGLTVTDGTTPVGGNFTVEVGLATIAMDDTATTDEDTAITLLDGAVDNVLTDDVGTGLLVTAFDATSAQGAAVNVNQDGTFSYDPRGAGPLQALAIGEQVVDSFTYTVTDFANNAAVVNVNVTVNGVNDIPSFAAEVTSSVNGSGVSVNLLANESDTDASDVLTVSNLTQLFGGGGPLPTDAFNFEFVPLVFTSLQGATVTISADGTFSYDVSTSQNLLSLAPGQSFFEDFEYDVFDGTATVSTSIRITSVGAGQPANDYGTTAANATVNIMVLNNDQVRKPGGALGAPTPGFNLEFHADTIGNSSTQWRNTGSATLASIPSNGVIDATFNPAAVNAPAGITATYDFAGVEGIVHLDFEQATYGDIDTANATLEMVIRPRDHVGNEVLWEVGGLTDGSSFTIVDDMVAWSSLDNGNQLVQAVAQLPPGAVTGGEFVHILAQIDLTNDTASIFINGQLAGSGIALNIDTGAVGNLADWCGTDDGGLGRRQTDVGGADPNLGNFGTLNLGALTDYDGEISLARTYPFLLSSAEIGANYNSIFGSPVAAVPGDILEVAGTASPGIGNPVVLPSGATVTLQADGSITYDPNNAFNHVGVGLSELDSFTYRLDAASNATVTVNVNVTGSNPDPQITIAAVNASTSEGLGTTFTISASAPVSGPVVVNLSFSGLADHGPDFTGAVPVQIADAATSVILFSNVLNDGIFEGIENIIVTIDSVVGNAVVGGTTAAETIVNDAQTAPEFSIAADQGSASEGTAATFTITPTVTSQAERTLMVSYTGTAGNGTDFFGQSMAVIPGGSATGTLSVLLFDDAVAEGTENLTVTLESADVGTIGAGNSGSTDITDGAAVYLFLADFENVDPFGVPGTPGGTLLGTDAPAAANLGTAIGSWENIMTATAGGDLPGIYFEINDHKGDGFDAALVQDRPLAGEGADITARFAAPADLSGGNSAFIGMDLGNRRTVGGTDIKSWRIIGLDDSGQKSFELLVSANNSGPNNKRLHHVDAGGVLTPLGAAFDFDNTGSTEAEDQQTRLVIALASGGYQVAIDRTATDGIFETVTGVLSYAGPATQVSAIRFVLMGSANINESSGIIIDDFKVSGTAGNVSPTATDDGNPLADGGTSILPDTFIGTGRVLGDVRVDDPDAGAGNVTATFQSVGAAPLTFSVTALGSASVGGNGTGTLTIDGTVTDVNATLGNVFTYNTDAVTGGNASILFAINDNGNTGPGGAKSISHNFDFFVNEGPTVTINQAPGQSDPTGVAVADFEVTFSEAVTGFDGTDVDLSGSNAPGLLGVSVSGGPTVYTVSITGMTDSGNLIISVPQGAANATAGGALTEASMAIDDMVRYVLNSSPTATNLVQNIDYLAGPVAIADIVVSDVNNSVISTALLPAFDFPAFDPDTLTLAPDPDTNAGYAVEVSFTPEGFDDFGTVRVFELGGSSNGFGIFLIDGVPHFVAKMDSTAAPIPSGLDDSDWADGCVSVPLSAAGLPLDTLAQIALICDLDSLTFSVNGMTSSVRVLTNRGTRNNWSGGDTLALGQSPIFGTDIGGLGVDPLGTFDEATAFEMLGTVTIARLWHDLDASVFGIDAVDGPEQVSVALNFTSGEGDLSVPAGVTYNAGAGTWTITGTVDEVNTALAAVQFVPNGTSPVTINVTIEDGDEDGSPPVMGTITLTTLSNDSDNDGIPNAFELANGLDPNDPGDGASDGDGDGWTALDEYLMGTDLNDPASSPFFDIVHVSATEVQIIYGPILAGRTYDVSASADGQSFSVIDTFLAPADAATNTTIDPSGNLDVELYQLSVTVP